VVTLSWGCTVNPMRFMVNKHGSLGWELGITLQRLEIRVKAQTRCRTQGDVPIMDLQVFAEDFAAKRVGIHVHFQPATLVRGR